ncbi:histidine--tRNA ligase [Candidatus Saccharibacteria bacterium RIFCSPHIGHO2_12_FULL_49_19]|nr:MAG: histidine--tRNA ligase [Candidatus Saccharibacteria bacterium RIFCSPHIGHO2_01_FULL_49_21]OGL37812.1 MAG: histidine--tRNA ligase [Candidatus Saccharibacteria bacterium RIFCSPHIGHO2_12_FULL_49_19]OGL38602.1 MAG: histidine--tRNA ligase [Candidatus Saccharibacteria bacterium RIFCSPLOWO2_01_FULL_49_22]
MSLPTQPYRGARDFYPEDKRVQKYMFSVLRRVVESFGYQEYDAPILEPIDIYIAKTSEEIVNEQTYSFTDRGGRSVTIRPDMTPSVSRMVAGRRQELAYPLRWYSIPNLWRYERPQAGRLREHWQLNVDLFGVSDLPGDHEIILVADSILRTFGAKRDSYEIRINSRLLLNWLMLEYLRLEHSQAVSFMRLIDRSEKISAKEFSSLAESLLTPTQRETDTLQRLVALLKVKRLVELPLVTQQHPAVGELEKLINLLQNSGIANVTFDLSLARGLDYYTNIVFEVFDKHPDNNRSMFGGGRYDGLVAEFGVDPVPTVGFGMGDVTLSNFLKIHKLLPELAPETDAVVILIGDIYETVQKTLANFREEGLRMAVDTTQRRLDSRIKSAAKSGVPYVIFIGHDELTGRRFKLKDLATGNEQELSLERIVAKIAPRHRPNRGVV